MSKVIAISLYRTYEELKHRNDRERMGTLNVCIVPMRN